ncbi:amidase [Falsiroseomonas bella]|uniref:Amidase n=1 Tax=Falsiroseomonas bella TaxID=2184016 RepID=A0A317FBR8_9PROT|nr:amidase [Falsiroseomonas bella]PWS36544.1 amidase [Falsiroseomonas bella]
MHDRWGIFWHYAPQPATDGPLAGLTLAVKDNVDVVGMPTTAGFAVHTARMATRDAPCVAGLRAGGAAILGKVAMHEGALGAITDEPRLCHNPLRHGFTPGGSSGGSGAAIAAGLADLAIGTDTMGSVRIPAAYCGVVGLKPTTGLVSRSGVVPLSPAFDHVGMLARTPRLAARGLEAMVSDDPTDPASRPAPDGWHAVPKAAPDLARLRIGLPEPILAAPMEPAVRAAWEAAAQRLRDAGAIVAPVAVRGWEPGAARRAGLLLIEAEAAALHEALIADPTATTPGFRAALQYGREAGTVRLARAMFRLAEVRAGALRALDACDLLLMPTAPQRAFAFGAAPPPDQADFTALANIAGLPAIALPWPTEDLPASVQLVSHAYTEALLVGVAEALSAP